MKLPVEISEDSLLPLQQKLLPKSPSRRNYVRIGRRFIAKRLLYPLIALVCLLLCLIWIFPPAMLEQVLHRYTEMELTDKRRPEFTGLVRLFDSTQMVYEGNIEKGAYTKGKLYNSFDQVIYDGAYKNGVKHGEGTLYDNDGTKVYSGAFANGEFSGAGKLYYPSGELKYEGGFLHGKYADKGTSYYVNGHVMYDGQFLEGIYNGAGKLFNGDGSVLYEGNFTAGQYNGEGKLYEIGKMVYAGQFVNGKYSGEGTEFYGDGKIKYKGPFIAGLYHGEKGTLMTPDGKKIYAGAFVNGKYQGTGEQFDQDERLVYKGQFTAGLRNGIGELFDQKGLLLYKGPFKQDYAYYPGFLGMSAKEVEALLGKATEVAVADTLTSVTMTYNDLQMELILNVPQKKTDESVVTIVRVGRFADDQIKAVIKGNGSKEDGVASPVDQLEYTVEPDGWTVTYLWDEVYLLKCTFDGATGKLRGAEITHKQS